MSRYVIMGVSGCGKSTVGEALAHATGLAFVDGDNLHPRDNIAKMARGVPLDDGDRAPWLARVGARLAQGDETIIACSALKRSYRDAIRAHAGASVTFVYLRGRRDTLVERMRKRDGHFMPVRLLDTQLETLEEPDGDERVVVADIEMPLDDIVAALARKIETGERP